jgi:nitrite reductase/ring-hydroxylating ferredoxin subunit
MMTTIQTGRYQRALRLEAIPEEGCQVVEIEGQTLALFRHQGQVYAVDNLCAI